MIAIPKQPRQPVQTQDDERFLQMIPAIERFARIAFRGLQQHDLEEAISEVVCDAFCAFRRLTELGKQDLAFATPLARFGVARFRSGRRIGNRMSSRDVTSDVAQRRQGFVVESQSCWLEILADKKSTPVPEQVAFRLDFSAWLKVLKRHNRKLAMFLALGNKTSEAAQRFGVSLARVSQVRRQLKISWEEFQGELA
jgi:hypothetical protein